MIVSHHSAFHLAIVLLIISFKLLILIGFIRFVLIHISPDKFCKEAGFTPNVAIEVEESLTIQQLVELGHGISFIPNLSVLRDSALNTVRIKISHPACKRTIGIAWNPNHYLSKATLEFREFSMEFFKNKVNEYII